MPENPSSVVQFWRDAGPKMWFAKDADFDRRFRERFLDQHEAAARQKLLDWLATAEGALALVLLLHRAPSGSVHMWVVRAHAAPVARPMSSSAVSRTTDAVW